MKRVMVTGATAPIGEALVRRLACDPEVEAVLAVGLEPTSSLGALDRVTYRSVDLRRSRSVKDLLFSVVRDLGVEGLVHTAQHRSARRVGADARRLDVEATRELLDLAERHPTLRRFVLRSDGAVYDVGADQPAVITEAHPLNLRPGAPEWQRNRVEADLAACTRMGMRDLQIAVLRGAEVLAPDTGSQLFDYLSSRVCLRPMGFDPMINLLSLEDQVDALQAALRADGVQGVFNIPGRDTLPISELIRMMGKADVPVAGTLLRPLYAARARLRGAEFHYGLNRGRMHFNGVLDGRRAAEELGYRPSHPLRPEALLAAL